MVSAIFLLVVMAALGAMMLTFSTVQHTTSAIDLQGSKAYQAAKTGIEWGVYQVLQVSPVCPGATALSPSGSLAGFAVTVTCSRLQFTEAGNNLFIYQITSSATSGAAGTPYFVERQLQVTVGR